jgi:hypothetical protein
VSVLRCPVPVRCGGRERIEFEDRHAFEVVVQSAHTRQTSDARADHNGMFSERCVPGVHRVEVGGDGKTDRRCAMKRFTLLAVWSVEKPGSAVAAKRPKVLIAVSLGWRC